MIKPGFHIHRIKKYASSLTSVRDKLKRLFSPALRARENRYLGRSCVTQLSQIPLTRIHIALGSAVMAISVAALPGYTLDDEPNNSYGDREILSNEIKTIQGHLNSRFDSDAYDFTFSRTLIPGQTEAFHIENLTPTEPFFAWVDNGEFGPDTVMGIYSEDNILLLSDDDGSPVGNGMASGISGVVNPDGTIHLAISGFPNFDFVGLSDHSENIHPESGDFDVYIAMGIEAPQGDVDYYTFTGLIPGSEFAVEVTDAPFDSTLAWLDDKGSIIYVDDDNGEELLSRIRGYVPLSGDITVAISAFGDINFEGQHIQSGDYVLTLTQP